MPDTPPVVFLTRPREASERFAESLRSSCEAPFSIVMSPVIRIEAVAPAPNLSGFSAVIFTSAHAVDATKGSDGANGMTAYCVGKRTWQSAKDAGFAAIDSGGDSQALIAKINEDCPDAPLVHLRGVHSHGDIARRLSENGIQTEELVVYDQVQTEAGPELASLIEDKRQLIVPVFSARSARLLSERFAGTEAQPHVVAISDLAAKAWNAPARMISVARQPDAISMREAVVRAIQSDSPC